MASPLSLRLMQTGIRRCFTCSDWRSLRLVLLGSSNKCYFFWTHSLNLLRIQIYNLPIDKNVFFFCCCCSCFCSSLCLFVCLYFGETLRTSVLSWPWHFGVYWLSQPASSFNLYFFQLYADWCFVFLMWFCFLWVLLSLKLFIFCVSGVVFFYVASEFQCNCSFWRFMAVYTLILLYYAILLFVWLFFAICNVFY